VRLLALRLQVDGVGESGVEKIDDCGRSRSSPCCATRPATGPYGNKVAPFECRWNHLTAYLERLKLRPSVARVLEEAEPYFHMFPADRGTRGASYSNERRRPASELS